MIKCVRISYILIVTVCILNIIHGLLFSRGSKSARSGCSSCSGSGIAVPVRIVEDSSQSHQPQKKVRRIRRLPVTSSCGCNSAVQQASSGWSSSGCITAAPQSSCGCQTAAPVSSCGCQTSAPAPQIAVPACISQPQVQTKGWGSNEQQQMYVIVEEQNIETMSPSSGWGQSSDIQQGWG
ncbi:uncharacterized protein LOC141856552 [Brevipalpus obovatus]|uniref:uncharacterized protein LOC141856552 n=1 Tax=Brevipalpus obovatus TaxID=246614 RepID=UPI003D9F0483